MAINPLSVVRASSAAWAFLRTKVGNTEYWFPQIALVDANGNALPGAGPQTTAFAESTAPLIAAATYTGGARDLGATQPYPASKFNVFAIADQIGTLFIDVSVDGVAWTVQASAALAVSTPLTLSAVVVDRFYRCRLVNGATAQTLLMIKSSFSGA
jgi:hypothetical protein